MATVTLNITNSQPVTITIASLANTSTNTSNAIDNSTNKFLSALVQVKLRTGSSGTASTGYCGVFLVRSADGGTTYDDSNKVLIGTVPMTANNTTYIATFSTEPFGPLGSHWKVAVYNGTGGALSSTAGDHSVQFAGVKYDVA
jgi:hypothetical protein